MSSELPEKINPRRLAEIGKELSGRYRVATMERMRTVLETDAADAEVAFHFRFFRNADTQQLQIAGNLETELPLICQRCMEVMYHRLDSRVDMIIVDDPIAVNALSGHFEPYSGAETPVALRDFVEDELLLLMPSVSLHSKEICPATDRLKQAGVLPESPFATLKKLRL